MFSTFIARAIAPDPEPGTARRHITIKLFSHNAMLYHDRLDGFIDDSAVSFVVGHAHRLAAEIPETDIVLDYEDHRLDNLICLRHFFLNNREALPQNVSMRLTFSSAEKCLNLTEQAIRGTSPYAYHHLEYVRLMIQCAGFTPGPDQKPVDVVCFLMMKNNQRLKHFHRCCEFRLALDELDDEIKLMPEDALHTALLGMRKDIAAEIEARTGSIPADSGADSPAARIARATTGLLKALRECRQSRADAIKLLTSYEAECRKILGEDGYLHPINSLLFQPAPLSRDVGAVIKSAKVLFNPDDPKPQAATGYRFIPWS